VHAQKSEDETMFGKNWQKSKATVVAQTIDGSANQGIDYKYVVEVRPEGGEPFRAEAKLPTIAVDFKEPRVGDVVGVEFHAKSHKVRFDKSDPQLSFKAYEAARNNSFEAALNAPVGSPAGPAPAGNAWPNGGGTAADGGQLAAVQALLAAAAASGASSVSDGVAGGGPAVVKLDRSNPDYEQLRAQLLGSFGVVEPQSGKSDEPTV
jgi:hypothetical protein